MRSVYPLLFLIAAMGFFAGCRPVDQIATYETPPKKAKPTSDRMLGAIVFQANDAWFFKATAPKATANKLEPAFRKFLSSVRFADGRPKWDLPPGWKESPANVELRFATLEAAVEGDSADVTVSKLPWSGDEKNKNDYVLRNVNRWRGQLQSRPALLVELLRDQEAVVLAEGKEAILVKLDGTTSARSGSNAMPSGHPPVGPSGPSPAGPSGPPPGGAAPPSGLVFKTPDGWTPGRTGGMRKAAFVVGEGEQQAEVTVIDLSAAAGSFAENVNRWRGQVMLKNASEAELEKSSKEIDVGGATGKYVELIGPKESILGVIAPSGNKTWFIKLKGEKSLAASQKKRFEEFVRSLQLP